MLIMFDAAYFRTTLPKELDAAGAEQTVELHLTGGHGHRVRSVAEVTDGYVVLEVYQHRGELSGTKGRWHGASDASGGEEETQRAAVSYESIAQIVIRTDRAAPGERIG